MTGFPDRLKMLRKSRDLTQGRLGELLGVHTQIIYRWESGAATPHFEKLVQLADLLQVSLDELAGRIEPKREFKIRNPKLYQLCKNLDILSDKDQEALVNIVDGLIKRNQLDKMMKSGAH